jgi:hypothetical protein
MDWEIGPDGKVTSGGSGAASDGDEDMAWALVMADRQWGGKGTFSDSYLNHAKKLIDLMWTYEIDQTSNFMLKPGDTKVQAFLDQAYAAVATLNLTAGTIYYQKSWTALSLLMLTGNFIDFTRPK